MTEELWDPFAARTPHHLLRASDADRERVIDTLATAFGQGRLTKDEFSIRAGQALASRTYGELAAITFSIPPRRSEALPHRTVRARNLNRIDRKSLTALVNCSTAASNRLCWRYAWPSEIYATT